MPVTYKIDPVRKVIRTTCSAPVTFDEVIGHFRTLQEGPACSGHLDVLLDVSQADALPESGQLAAVNLELRGIRDKVQFGICAIVAHRDAMFGMMRMFEVQASRYFHAIRVFRDAAEAEPWVASPQGGSGPGV
jgi:hypothetical protein